MKCPKCKVQMTRKEYNEGICPLLCGWEVRKPRKVTAKVTTKVETTVTVVSSKTSRSVGILATMNQQESMNQALARIAAIETEISEWVELRAMADDDEWVEIGFEIASLQRAKETVQRNSPELMAWMAAGNPSINGHTD